MLGTAVHTSSVIIGSTNTAITRTTLRMEVTVVVMAITSDSSAGCSGSCCCFRCR